MNGLSDVRVKLYGSELERAQREARLRAPRFIGTLRLWRHRWETRRALLELTPAQLKDIGLSRGDAVEEGLKPFWRS
ncbi:DUF1127 domain-containing protein [Pseudomonas japonica]|uniref:Uncharacterized conserved protein YjiS, DUF1127 family n=1 Tax=Pseudomonas japonica TaxID=256466 RepID=A0A239B7X1_9PSED|nr:DUF1127 domain-containing protein [Pseudomonas japonica]SNS03970.1 Uncharacterized conserved protein YjiS, DUF1127 family [Pseudomonas japonica]